MNRTVLIILGVLAIGVLALVALVVIAPHENRRRGEHSVGESERPPSPSNMPDHALNGLAPPPIKPTLGGTPSAKPLAKAVQPWNPDPVLMPGWGEFLVEIIALGPNAGNSMDEIRLLASAPPPHFAVRYRPAPGTESPDPVRRDFEGQLEVFLTSKLEGLSIEQAGEPWVEDVVEGGSAGDATRSVHVIPFEIMGLSSWSAETGSSRGKIAARSRNVTDFRRGYVATKDFRIVGSLAGPSIEPGAPEVEDPFACGLENAQYVNAIIYLNDVSGLRTASIELWSRETRLPVNVVTLRLTMGRQVVPLPTSEPLGHARLQIVARAAPGWWTQRQGLVVVFEVWDDGGHRHTLRWEPKFD